jgi:hypothetical protein
MPGKSLQSKWQQTMRYRMVALCSIAAALLIIFPLQKYFPMGRFQHYAIGFGMFSIGQICQLLASWRLYSKWGRISFFATGVCYGTIAFIFWTNPWLDYRVAVQTESKEQFRMQLIFDYLVCNLVIIICWLKCWSEELKKQKEELGVSDLNS